MLTSEDRAGIGARIDNCRTYNFGMRDADRLAHEDADILLAALAAVEAQLAAIEKVLETPVFHRRGLLPPTGRSKQDTRRTHTTKRHDNNHGARCRRNDEARE